MGMRIAHGRRRRRYAPLLLLVVLLFLLAVLFTCVSPLSLSSHGITNITAQVDPDSSRPLSFTFWRDPDAFSNVKSGATSAGSGSSYEIKANWISVATLTYEQVSAATEWDLSDNALQSIPISFFQAMESVETIVLSKNPLVSLAKSSFYERNNLRSIVMHATNLTELPTSAIQSCPQLKSVEITGGYLRSIAKRSIGQLPQLETVNLSKNNLTLLYADSFFELPELHTMKLGDNNLTNVPPSLLALSKSWHVLDFRNNFFSHAPAGIQNATVGGYLSFEGNRWVEINTAEFANASRIRSLNLRSMAIFTIHAKAFEGMSGLHTLDLGDNVISVLASDAFTGLESLQSLSLDDNRLQRVQFTEFPPKLNDLDLSINQLYELPVLHGDFNTTTLKRLNLSHNRLWQLDQRRGLLPFSVLTSLDLSWNLLQTLPAHVFDHIQESLLAIYLDFNEISSVPRSTFEALFQSHAVDITLARNPGVDFTSAVRHRSICPSGSVYDSLALSNKDSTSDNGSGRRGSADHSKSSDGNNDSVVFYGCWQCEIGWFHDANGSRVCLPCQSVSPRRFSSQHGATSCEYCAMSRSLDPSMSPLAPCQPFTCNVYCWLTFALAVVLPGCVILVGKYALRLHHRLHLCGHRGPSEKTWIDERQVYKNDEQQLARLYEAEQELDDWIIVQLRRYLHSYESNDQSASKLGTARTGSSTAALGCEDRSAVADGKLYELSRDLQAEVLVYLQQHFEQCRRPYGRYKDSDGSEGIAQDGDRAKNQDQNHDQDQDQAPWRSLTWESFHMSRILSRNGRGEVFLGSVSLPTANDHDERRLLVVKRLMTLRFDVTSLVHTIGDMAFMLALPAHGQLVRYLGAMWTDREYLCVVCEYMAGGDLRAWLDSDAVTRPPPPMTDNNNSSSNDNNNSHNTEEAPMALRWLSWKLQIACDVVAGVAFLHRQGAWHGELCTHRILLTADHGRAKLDAPRRTAHERYAATSITVLSRVGEDHDGDDVNGTDRGHSDRRLPVAAPEVRRREGMVRSPVAERERMVDIYSLGIVLIELIGHKSVAMVEDDGGDHHLGHFETILPSSTHRGEIPSTLRTRSWCGRARAVNQTDAVVVDVQGGPEPVISQDEREYARLQRSSRVIRDAGASVLAQFVRSLRLAVHRSATTSSGDSSALVTLIHDRVLDAVEMCLQSEPANRVSVTELLEVLQQHHRAALSALAKGQAVATCDHATPLG